MPEPIVTPPANQQAREYAYRGSMQEVLAQNLGNYVVCEFLIGTQSQVEKQGILYDVGVSWMVLYELPEERYVICDFYSLKFITFYQPGKEPQFPGTVLPPRR